MHAQFFEQFKDADLEQLEEIEREIKTRIMNEDFKDVEDGDEMLGGNNEQKLTRRDKRAQREHIKHFEKVSEAFGKDFDEVIKEKIAP